MLSIRFRARAAHLVLVSLTLVGCVTDQAVMARDYDNDSDGPARVGRISYLSGRVDAYTDEQSSWGPAYLNLPVTSNTGIWTAHEAKAEVTIGSTSIHIDDDSEVDFDELDDDGIEIDLENGNFVQRVRQLPRDERWYVHAGDSRIQWVSPGSYAVAYKERSHALTVKVFSGTARVDSNRGSYTVYGGQQLTLDEDDGNSQISNRVATSNFEEWADRRNRAFDQSEASRYVSPEMTGAEQLDSYGRWSQDTTYGAVWFPTQVVVGWAPYRYGHWAWIVPWGWTWVDDAPWGFAPFHYGRWVQVSGRWAWCPGPRVARPAFAPALVRVQEHDNHRPTRWVPLAPREPFQRDFFKPTPRSGQPAPRPATEWNRTPERGNDPRRDRDREDGRNRDHYQQPGQGNARPPVVIAPTNPAKPLPPQQTAPTNSEPDRWTRPQPNWGKSREHDSDDDRKPHWDQQRPSNGQPSAPTNERPSKPVITPRRDDPQPTLNPPRVQTPAQTPQAQAQQVPPAWRQHPQAPQQVAPGEASNTRNDRPREQRPNNTSQTPGQSTNQPSQPPWQWNKPRPQGDNPSN